MITFSVIFQICITGESTQLNFNFYVHKTVYAYVRLFLHNLKNLRNLISYFLIYEVVFICVFSEFIGFSTQQRHVRHLYVKQIWKYNYEPEHLIVEKFVSFD